jgi:hypothetical protein
MNHMNTAGHCKCPHHKVGAVLIVLFGLTFLLGTMGVLSGMFVAYAWPVLIIIFGLTRLMGGSCSCYTKV